MVRKVDAVLDLSWGHAELAAHYPGIGRPSIDPVLMIRMLIVGYVFAIRSERQLCPEVQVNLAYRWICNSTWKIFHFLIQQALAGFYGWPSRAR